MSVKPTEIKRQLRRSILRERQALSGKEWQFISSSICRQIVRLYDSLDKPSVFAYAAMLHEPDLSECFVRFGRVALPVVTGERSMKFYNWEQGDPLKKNRFGILEPARQDKVCVPSENSLVIIPCLAASAEGVRLGFGGGYYDTYLSHHSSGTTVGVCLERHILQDLPIEAHDVRLSRIVSESRQIRCREG